MQRQRILIVDDDADFRRLLGTMLRPKFLTFEAGDGNEAFDVAAAHRPDAMVVDLSMPVCDGLQLMTHLKTRRSLQSVPVLVLSSDGSKKSVLSAIQHGAHDYMLKSALSHDGLLQRLGQLLTHGKRALATGLN